MDMNRRDLAKAETAQDVEQNNGIATTGKPHPKVRIRLETGGEQGAHPIPEIS
jgi:hypothetical protein